MADALSAISTRKTSQSEKAAAEQVENAAGGFAFKLDDEARVQRFLAIGTDGGTYYVGEKELTKENAEVVIRVASGDKGIWLVNKIVEISEAGRAPKQNPGIFALAVCSSLGTDETRSAAFAAVKRVCRTTSTLMLYVKYRAQFAGWARGHRLSVGRWFTDKPVEDVAYQVVKYRSREGWSNRDLLRSAHPVIDVPSGKALFNWLATGDVVASRGPGGESRGVGATREDLPALIVAFEEAQAATTVAKWVELIEAHNLPWEAFPDAAKKERKVWAALITNKRLPIGALVRQLPTLTNAGVFDDATLLGEVTQRLTSEETLKRGRIHPINQLIALKTYQGGRSLRGSSTWTPKRQIVDALDASFYAAFGAVEPSNKRLLLGLDVSGSMTWANVGDTGLTPRDLSAAIALVTVATEASADVIAFTGGWGARGDTAVTELDISPRQRLDDVIRTISRLGAGPTDCALPMTWAQARGKQYDCFGVYTDGETWYGDIHPFQALKNYRQKMGIDARSVHVAMTGTSTSLADPTDLGMLDIPGFDAAVPRLISSFARGEV